MPDNIRHLGHSHVVGRQQNSTIILKKLAFLNRAKDYLPCDPEIAFLGIFPKEIKTCVSTQTFVQECPQQL